MRIQYKLSSRIRVSEILLLLKTTRLEKYLKTIFINLDIKRVIVATIFNRIFSLRVYTSKRATQPSPIPLGFVVVVDVYHICVVFLQVVNITCEHTPSHSRSSSIISLNEGKTELWDDCNAYSILATLPFPFSNGSVVRSVIEV